MIQNRLRRQYLLPYLALLMLVTGCGSRSQSAAPAAFESGGLGSTKAEWEQHHVLSGTYTNSSINFRYDANMYDVNFWTAETSVPSNSTIVQMWANVPPGGDIKTFLSALLPKDAELKDTLQTTGLQGTFTEIYESPSLAQRYPPLSLPKGTIDTWQGVVPGTIYVVYTHGE